jgi:hypothetical protein
MDAMDDRYNYASPLTGHQDPVPNSDAARLRLDSPTLAIPSFFFSRTGYPLVCYHRGRAQVPISRLAPRTPG